MTVATPIETPPDLTAFFIASSADPPSRRVLAPVVPAEISAFDIIGLLTAVVIWPEIELVPALKMASPVAFFSASSKEAP